jgi:capsular polysaccharide export protein
MWLHYMSTSGFILDYRYHARPITNRVVYPPYWIEEDMQSYLKNGDALASILAKRAIGVLDEPRI